MTTIGLDMAFRTDRKTSETEIVRVLRMATHRLSAHEIYNAAPSYSENNYATRLPNLALRGVVVGGTRPGTRYKEWELAKPGQQDLPLA